MILAIYTRKGGTGKTTTAITLGNILANKGLRTLLVDLDSQANATSHFLTTPPALDTSAAFLQGDMPIIKSLVLGYFLHKQEGELYYCLLNKQLELL